MEASLFRKYSKLQKIFLQYKKIAVAFSGGVDSSFLLYVACATVDPSLVYAFHARSELLPPLEAGQVERVVHECGCAFHPIEIEPFSWPEFVANVPDRCYLCKKKIYQTFSADPFFAQGGVLCDGTNHDDFGQDRPGLRAVAELNVQTPLADVGFTKKEIRLLSREFSLSTWNAPASSCLATRIAQRETITREKILMVARSEALLQKKGFIGCRVRFSEGVATIVVQDKDISEIHKKCVFSDIRNDILSFGFRNVIVDPKGRRGLAG